MPTQPVVLRAQRFGSAAPFVKLHSGGPSSYSGDEGNVLCVSYTHVHTQRKMHTCQQPGSQTNTSARSGQKVDCKQMCTRSAEFQNRNKKCYRLPEAASPIKRTSPASLTHTHTQTSSHTSTRRNRALVRWPLKLIKPILCCGSKMINLVYHS